MRELSKTEIEAVSGGIDVIGPLTGIYLGMVVLHFLGHEFLAAAIATRFAAWLVDGRLRRHGLDPLPGPDQRVLLRRTRGRHGHLQYLHGHSVLEAGMAPAIPGRLACRRSRSRVRCPGTTSDCAAHHALYREESP